MGRRLSALAQAAGWLLGGALALLFVLFVALTATTPGSRWLVGQAEQHVSGLRIGAVEGNLWQGLQVSQLVFRAPDGFSVQLGKASIELDWRQFWHFSLQIKSLRADDVRVELPPPKPSAPPGEPLDLANLPISIPVAVQVLDLRINRFSLWQTQPDQAAPASVLSLATLHAAGQADHRAVRLSIHELQATVPQAPDAQAPHPAAIEIAAQGWLQLAVAAPHAIEGTVSSHISTPQGWLLAQTTLEGNLKKIMATLDARWEGFTTPFAQMTAQVGINAERADLTAFSIDTLDGTLCGKGTVDYAHQLNVLLQGQATGLNPASLAPAAAGKVGFHYQFQYGSTATQPGKPAASELAVHLTDLTGTVADVPFRALVVNAALADQHVQVAVTAGTLADGALRAEGQMGLASARPLALDLHLDRAAVQDVLARMGVQASGSVSTRFKLSGTLGKNPLHDARLDFAWSIPQTALHFPATAKLKQAVNVPVALALNGAVAGQQVNISQAQITLADSTVAASGHVNTADLNSPTALALSVNAKVTQLARLPWAALNLANLAGSVDLNTRIKGSVQQPEGTVDVRARHLAYAQWHLGHLGLKGRVRKNNQVSVYDFSLNADQLKQIDAHKTPQLRLQTLRLDGQGQWLPLLLGDRHTDQGAAQRFALRAQSPLGQIDLALDGMLAQIGPSHTLTWEGQLKRLDIRPTRFEGKAIPAWHLEKPSDLTLSGHQQMLGTTCLAIETAQKNPSGHVCVGLSRKIDGEKATGQVDADLPLALIKPWLPVAADLPGRVTLTAQAQAASGKINGALKLDLPQSTFRLPDLLGARPYAYSNTALTATIRSGVVDLNLQADVPRLFTVQGGGRVALAGTQALSLKATASLMDASVLERMVPQVAQLKGRARANISVGGTLKQPKPSGQVRIDRLAFTLPDTGVAYDQGQFDARIDAAGQLAFSGGLTGVTTQEPASSKPPAKQVPASPQPASAMGASLHRVLVQGTGDLADLPRWRLKATVQGQAVPVLRLPSLVIDAGPDLTIEASEAGAHLDGTIRLPTVTARVEKLPEGVVQSSGDLVIVGEKKPEPKVGYPFNAGIKLILGKAVSLAGMGFSTNLQGQLKLQLQPKKPMAAIGEIDLVNGVYKAYGQNLTVKQGRLLFVGPLDDPGISATAQRVVADTTVGLNITGTLYHPKTTVFSSPSLPESDALSMLLTGRPLSDSGSGDRAMLMNAIAGLGVAQGSDIVRDIGQKFGLDSVGLDTSGGFADTRLSIGKQIGDRLFVRYAIGVVNGLSEIITQYKLSKLFSIEITTSPEATGGDLIYRIH